jgi:hypothetical protein
VLHPKFGEGIVLNFEGVGQQSRVQIQFDDVGAKWFFTAYARLEALCFFPLLMQPTRLRLGWLFTKLGLSMALNITPLIKLGLSILYPLHMTCI